MRSIAIIVVVIIVAATLQAQEIELANSLPVTDKKASLTIGILNGGGSLVGVDFETLLSERVGLQFGAGYIGLGGGLNYHFKPGVRSSFLSLQYMHQGVGVTHTQSLISNVFGFRSKKWFAGSFGFGFPVNKGPAWPDDLQQSPFQLVFSIGAYFPI